MTGRGATPTTKPQAAGASPADAPTQSRGRPSKNRGVIEYRRLTAEDCEPVAAFAIEGMPSHEGLLLSPQKVRAVVWHFWKSATDFHLVAWEGRKVVGLIAAAVGELVFFERAEAVVVACQARGVPGVGRELIRRLMEWAKGAMLIRRVQFPTDLDARPGFQRLLRRAGFNQTQTVCVMTKG